MEPDGIVRALDASAWQRREQRVTKLGGPPIP
jgi:hypothetical protein